MQLCVCVFFIKFCVFAALNFVFFFLKVENEH